MSKNLRILLCDDNTVLRTALVAALSFRGVDVLGDYDSFEDLAEQFRQLRPDVVLVDINLPGISGTDGIRVMRSKGINVPVVAMSADIRNEPKAIAAGANGFFYKGSTDFAKLVDILRAALAAAPV